MCKRKWQFARKRAIAGMSDEQKKSLGIECKCQCNNCQPPKPKVTYIPVGVDSLGAYGFQVARTENTFKKLFITAAPSFRQFKAYVWGDPSGVHMGYPHLSDWPGMPDYIKWEEVP